MGSFGSLLGIGQGNDKSGAQFQAASAGNAQQAALANPVSSQQAQDATTAATGALGQQQALAQALQAQNGIGNQSSVFNQLQGVANGTGPNPAQAMLAQSTGANTANQAALMAGQRGAGSNTGLMARQAAMQGGANQQSAVGQGATMQANQSLNALNSMGSIAGQQVSQQANAVGADTSAAQAQQGQMLGQVNAQNQAALTQASNTNTFNNNNTASQNTANTAIQLGNQKSQAGALGGIMNAAGSIAGLAHGGVVKNYADGGPVDAPKAPSAPTIKGSGPQSSVGKILSGVGQTNQSQDPTLQGSTNMFNGITSGIGKLLGPSQSATPDAAPSSSSGADMASAMGADPMTVQNISSGGTGGGNTTMSNGGRVKLAGGGSLFNLNGAPESSDSGSSGGGGGGGSPAGGGDSSGGGGGGGASALSGLAAALSKGGKVPAMVSPGEVYLDPKNAKDVAKGKKSPMVGEMIKGKAKVKGDSLKNDTVPKTLDAGGVVIPRSIIQGPNAHQEAYKFVNAAMAKHGMKAKSKK